MKLLTKKRNTIRIIKEKFGAIPIPLVLLFGEIVILNKYNKEVKNRKRVVSKKFHTADLLVSHKKKQITRV